MNKKENLIFLLFSTLLMGLLIGLVYAGVFQGIENGEDYTLPFRVNLTSNYSGDYYSFIDLDKSLIFYMGMDDLNSSGHPIDLSSYGNNGTLVGNPIINSTHGFFGNGTKFNGASDKIVIQDNYALNSPGVGNEITICSWININNHGGSGFKGIVGKWKDAERQYLLGRDTATNKYGLILSNDGGTHTTNGAILLTDSILNTNQWYHLCGSYNGSNMYVYLNSQKQSGTANSKGIFGGGSGDLEIGTFYNNSNYAFNGSIDEVLIFNRSLSSDEIKSLYNSSLYKFDYEFNSLNLGGHSVRGYSINKSGYLNNTNLISFNIVEQQNPPAENLPLGIGFVYPTPNEDVTENSIYVNLSTNGRNSYSFINFDSDLVGWWRMDDEDIGVLIDKSGYTNDGVFKDGVATTDLGRFGRALKVNGSSYVDILDSSSLDSPGLTDKITICSWIKINNHGGSGYKGIVGKYDTITGTNNRAYLMSKNDADNKYGIFLSKNGKSHISDGAQVVTNSELNTNQWYHLCGTSNGTVKLYLDGVLQSQTATLADGIVDNTIANLTIGKFGKANSGFNGLIDEVLIFKRDLSEKEIKALYNSSIYHSENNFIGLLEGSHSFTGYVVNASADYLYSSRTISSGMISSAPNLTLLSNTNYENFYNMEYQISVTNAPNNCFYSRDYGENISMNNLGSGMFTSSESLDAGIYNLTFYCNNSYGVGSLEKQFVLRKSITNEHTYFTNSEGLNIYYDFYFNCTSEKGPLLIVPDSWSSTKDSYRLPVMALFRPRGYSIVLVDTRGKGSSQGTRGAFLEECIDIYEVINEVKTNSKYSHHIGENIYIWGFSAGGGRAGACSARYPDLFSGIFSTGGVLNVTKWWYLNSGYRSDLESRIGGTPATNPEGYLMRDASYLSQNILSPAMVTHYTGDAAVNVGLSRDYNSSMNLNAKEIRYDEYVGGSHAIVGLSDSINYFAEHRENNVIPEKGKFILSGFLFSKNFTIKFNDRTKLGSMSYDISNFTKYFNISSVSYNGGCNISLLDLSANTEYLVSVAGVENILTTNNVGNLNLSFNISNSSVVIIIISPMGEYCGDGICNNGETCSSCPGDCGVCVVNPPSGNSGGSSGGGGGGGGGNFSLINATGKLSVSKLGKIIALEGDKKTLALNVKNFGKSFLNKCRLVVKGDIASWVYSTQIKGIAPGENMDFNFDLNVPDGLGAGEYTGELEIICDEGINIQKIKISIFGLTIIDVKEIVNEKNILKINYSLNSSNILGDSVSVDIWIVDKDGVEIQRIKDVFFIDNELTERDIEIKIDKNGIYSIYFALSDDLNKFIKKSIVVGKANTTGFAIFDSPVGKNIVYGVFLLIIGVGIFFIWFKREKTEPVKSKWLLRKKAMAAVFVSFLFIVIFSMNTRFTGLAVGNSSLLNNNFFGVSIFCIFILGMMVLVLENKQRRIFNKSYSGNRIIRGLLNKQVYTEEGESLGKIKDVILGDCKIEKIKIGFNFRAAKEFGSKGILIKYNLISKMGDIILLKDFQSAMVQNKLDTE